MPLSHREAISHPFRAFREKVSIMASEIPKSSVTEALWKKKFKVDVYSCSALS